MNKYILKRNLVNLDHNELETNTIEDVIAIFEGIASEEKEQFTNDLLATKELIFLENSYDLTAPITLFARSPLNSNCERIALFETLLKNTTIRNYLKINMHKEYKLSEIKELFSTNRFLLPTILDSHIFSLTDHNTYILATRIKQVFPMLVEEIEEPCYIVSTISMIYYIHDIVNFNSEMKDNKAPVYYPNSDFLYSVVPQMSVFKDRSRTEFLQNFFKDSLMQEFQHVCPICGINIPHMLIASHIRPFRDCGHLIESCDHNNGILLCKNHDYLFDQGYISFQDDGTIIISDKIKEELYPSFGLKKDFVLPKRYLSKQRKIFFDYHRKNIYQL